MEIGDRIRMVRIGEYKEDAKKYSTREFADMIGISSGAVTSLEKGRNNPSEQTIRLICEKFGVRRGWLEFGDGEPEIPEAEDDYIIDQEMWKKSPHIRALTKAFVKKFGWEALEELLNTYYIEATKQAKIKKDPDL